MLKICSFKFVIVLLSLQLLNDALAQLHLSPNCMELEYALCTEKSREKVLFVAFDKAGTTDSQVIHNYIRRLNNTDDTSTIEWAQNRLSQNLPLDVTMVVAARILSANRDPQQPGGTSKVLMERQKANGHFDSLRGLFYDDDYLPKVVGIIDALYLKELPFYEYNGNQFPEDYALGYIQPLVPETLSMLERHLLQFVNEVENNQPISEAYYSQLMTIYIHQTGKTGYLQRLFNITPHSREHEEHIFAILLDLERVLFKIHNPQASPELIDYVIKNYLSRIAFKLNDIYASRKIIASFRLMNLYKKNPAVRLFILDLLTKNPGNYYPYRAFLLENIKFYQNDDPNLQSGFLNRLQKIREQELDFINALDEAIERSSKKEEEQKAQ